MNQIYDMRSPIYNRIVDNMRKVDSARDTFRKAHESLGKRADAFPEISGKCAAIAAKLDDAVPNLYLYFREKNTRGIISDSELVRRLHGPNSVAEKTLEAAQLVSEAQNAIDQETAKPREGLWNRIRVLARGARIHDAMELGQLDALKQALSDLKQKLDALLSDLPLSR